MKAIRYTISGDKRGEKKTLQDDWKSYQVTLLSTWSVSYMSKFPTRGSMCAIKALIYSIISFCLKGVLTKNERGFRFTVKNNRFWSQLILLISVASKRTKNVKNNLYRRT